MATLTIFFSAADLLAQEPRIRDVNFHSWWVYTGDHPLTPSSKWGVLAEFQARRSDFAAAEQQYQSRNALTYKLTPAIQLANGYVYTHTARYGGYPVARPFGEHRIFQQVRLRHSYNKLDLEHRYRNEFRWLQAYTQGNDFYYRYQMRFRYQLRGTYPIKGRWYAWGADEIFVPYGPNFGLSAFDQNRAFAGVGFKLSPRNSLEVAYVNQFLIQRNGRIEESNHTFRLSIISTEPLFQRKR